MTLQVVAAVVRPCRGLPPIVYFKPSSEHYYCLEGDNSCKVPTADDGWRVDSDEIVKVLL